MMTMRSLLLAAPILLLLLLNAPAITADEHAVASGNKSFLVALGCFWCAEQAFEQYAPGVVEAVSGYAGADGIENPTYRNHPGHYEVIIVEYDPSMTSFRLMIEYAFRNMDPFDGRGQFCDKGSAYKPALFYATDEERAIIEEVRDEVLASNGWEASDIAAPILARPKFWKAEEYHQDYYIKNPLNYGYYKNACGRTNRLKEVWGEDEYYCYHDEEHGCFEITVVNDEGEEVAAVLNEQGEEVAAVTNVKDAPEEVVGLLPRWAIYVISFTAVGVVLVLLCWCSSHWPTRKRNKGETVANG